MHDDPSAAPGHDDDPHPDRHRKTRSDETLKEREKWIAKYEAGRFLRRTIFLMILSSFVSTVFPPLFQTIGLFLRAYVHIRFGPD